MAREVSLPFSPNDFAAVFGPNAEQKNNYCDVTIWTPHWDLYSIYVNTQLGGPEHQCS